MRGWPRRSGGGWMAETSGPRGPCTAPRRRCSPAWLWTVTAWARQPRPVACPPRVCPARCSLGSTCPASTFIRTRVSSKGATRPPCDSSRTPRESRGRNNRGGTSRGTVGVGPLPQSPPRPPRSRVRGRGAGLCVPPSAHGSPTFGKNPSRRGACAQLTAVSLLSKVQLLI